jgi:hypothetical protein
MQRYEVPDRTDRELKASIRRTLHRFPDLNQVYDSTMVGQLVRKKRDTDNFLLRLLCCDDDEVLAYWRSVLSDITALSDSISLRRLRIALRNMNQVDLDRLRLALHLAARFARKGCGLSFQLQTGHNEERYEFNVSRIGQQTVTFAVRNAVPDQELRRFAGVVRKIWTSLENLPVPYLIEVRCRNDLEQHQLTGLRRFLEQKLHRLYQVSQRKSEDFPYDVRFDDRVVIRVLARSRKASRGLVGSVVLPATWVDNPTYVMKMLRSALMRPGLPGSGPGVLVLDCSKTPFMKRHAVELTLLGRREVTISTGDRGTVIIRSGEALFRPRKNRRVSALLTYSRDYSEEMGERTRMWVYHNPHARYPLDPDFFFGEEVKQWVVHRVKQNTFSAEWIE